MTMPSNDLLTIASSEDSTIAARTACASALGRLEGGGGPMNAQIVLSLRRLTRRGKRHNAIAEIGIANNMGGTFRVGGDNPPHNLSGGQSTVVPIGCCLFSGLPVP